MLNMTFPVFNFVLILHKLIFSAPLSSIPVQVVAPLDHWSSSPVGKQSGNPSFYPDGTGQMEILAGQLMSLSTEGCESCEWKVAPCLMLETNYYQVWTFQLPLACWSRDVILALGVRGSRFKSRTSPSLGINCVPWSLFVPILTY